VKKLAPNLFDRRFGDLLELGRARLPSLAPDWTDHNAHDPGVTLMELLAWVAEAQIYSLSRRPRRDERAAYAAMMGIAPTGTQGASGVIWPDRLAVDSPFVTHTKSVAIRENAVINVVDAGMPTFRPTHPLLWAPGRIERLETRDAQGVTADHTTTNERGGLPFAPFGDRAGKRDVLALTFQCRDRNGLFGSDRSNVQGALWPIGVLAAPPTAVASASTNSTRSPITATMVTDTERFPLRIVSDTTRGFLTTGVLLFDLDSVTGSPARFTIELRSPGGFARPPRVLRIESNVVPILQGHSIVREVHEEAAGVPDWSFRLEEPGLRFAKDEEAAVVEVAEGISVDTWRRVDHLSDQGPSENAYEIDTTRGQITFGNGVNGRIPPAGSQAFVTYSVSEGERGAVARNRKWQVAGFAGAFGVNPDPITGGAAASGFIKERREARRRAREDHALVSARDIKKAAEALPLLEVARAWVAAPNDSAPRTGVVTLVALRSRPGKEPELPPETPRWLEAIRRRLAPQIPLGARLAVVAPQYVGFTIQAELECEQGRNPSVVRKDIEKELQKRLAVLVREPGVGVTQRDVAAWMRATDGVRRVIQTQLRRLDGQIVKDVIVPRGGLPRWDSARSRIEVRRP